MQQILLQQYRLVLSARSALFDYCKTLKPEDSLKPLPAFNNESILSQLIHVANCYLFWLSKTAMQQLRPFFNNEEHQDIPSVIQVFDKVDIMMHEFLHYFSGSLEQQRLITRPDGRQLTRSPFEIFTHVITHEFHHKGQVVSMSRQLGYTPVDTDVVRE
ncbi:DinB family protein [Mucilaginibacter psychrotolerans]|uniref:Damage-inducible protein DinB n=1 Tax=Mucilaginibacter psychrotolerans TaxID=1524096 RepID=A0A4Y8SEH2_9SPHI|nr:DinB family protein [Mucilaginibacter psychrotolerans]TFF37278.1 hypothetical protein E2R66_12645 [Mucilaginibacter psychrotolerans]